MNASNNARRRLALGLALLTATTGALAFTFTLNTSNPPPNGTGLPYKWAPGTVQLRLMLGDTANLTDGASFNQSARTAALTWNGLLGNLAFQTENATGNPADNNSVNELGFAANVYGREFGENTLAVTTGYSLGNETVETDIIFNTAYTWDSYRGNLRRTNGVATPDIQRVALHELGHALGLDHPDEAGQSVNAVMNSTISNVDALTADDTEGAQSLYGPPGTPANDGFANAKVIALSGTKSVTVKGVNTNATKEAGEPNHDDNGGGRSVWWTWTSPAAGNVALDTRGSYCDTLLGVYTGSAVGSLTKIASNDDIDPGIVQASRLNFPSTAGTTYRIAVDGYNSSDGAGADSAGITLNLVYDGDLGSLPTITTQPANATVTRGSSVSFSVAATGTAPLAYQWSLGGAAISGATSATYSIASAATDQAGTYTVTISNSAGSVTSNSATLTVNTPAPPPPPSTGGGGGGGGAPSTWFLGVLAVLALARCWGRREAERV